MQARSYTIDQHWSDMTQADRVAWENLYGDAIRERFGKLVAEAQAFTRYCKSVGAHELHDYDPDKHVSAIISAVARQLADEVKQELGIGE